ncbi:MAG TPA: autotransporter assembly complex family protein [Gammaproteobacteria bacterium]|nr:autotransporter assembly complex family protein [Gammaproteobacteria bacterium]
MDGSRNASRRTLGRQHRFARVRRLALVRRLARMPFALRPRSGRFAVALALTLSVSLGLVVSGPAAADVELTGVEGPIRENALLYIRLDNEPCDAPEWRVRRLYQEAVERLPESFQAFGYYSARVTPSLQTGGDCWKARFAVDLGKPVLVRKLDVLLTGDARNDAPFARLLESPGIAVGAPLEHAAYERLKTRLRDLASARGYAQANFETSRIDVFPDDLAADVVLHFDSGKRFSFGPVELHQDALSDDLVRSFVRFKPGEPYDGAQVTDLYVALTNSGFFDTVTVTSLEPDAEKGEIPVRIELTPAASRQISYGIGFSTDTKVRLRFGRHNRRFNERGAQFGVDAQLSPVTSEVTVNYRFPHGDPRTEWVSFDGGLKHESTATSSSSALELGVRRILERPHGWTRTDLASLRIEDFTVGDQIGRSNLLMPSTAWTRLRADNSVRPSKGSKLTLELRGTDEVLGSDTGFMQLVARGKWIRSPSAKSRLIVRADVGATAEESFEALPPSVRFFAGGDNSVRGYAFQSLGPVDENGQVIGGSSLVTASFEYERRIKPQWSIATFVDSGNAYRRFEFDPKTSAGIGARWISPLGPIRVDVGFPLERGDRGARLHITLGPDL